MKTKRLGENGPEVSALGLGLMGMSDFYGAHDETESVATIHAALEAGVTLLDTGDFYGMGHNEMLLARAFDGPSRRQKAFVQVKFGALRDPTGAFLGFDGRPVAVKTSLAYTLRRLRTDYVDLFMPARVDPAVPIEETVGAIADCVKAGWVRHIGLSEVSAETLRRARKVHPITSVQGEYALITREAETSLFPALREAKAGFTAYGVLSRGLLSGRIRTPDDVASTDYRAHLPRFAGENLVKNLRLVDVLAEMAGKKDLTAAQMAIAWVAARGDHVVPLIGARRVKRLQDALHAAETTLSAEELRALDARFPVGAAAGSRYDEMGMRLVDA